MFHVKQESTQIRHYPLPNLVENRPGFPKKLNDAGKTEKNREKLKKMLAFPCFLCYNH